MSAEKVYAYFVLQTVLEVPPMLDLPAGYVAEPQPSTILLSDVNYGNGTHTVTFDDGPIKSVTDLVYLGTGTREDAGELMPKITFDLGVKRILNLISIGTSFEQVLVAQIHEFADQAKGFIERHYPAAPSQVEDGLGEQLRAIDNLEKHFFDRKR